MSAASLTSQGPGLIVVKGPVTFATVATLLVASRDLFAPEVAVVLDLKEVTDVDSAGLALLLEWLRQGREHRRAVTFQGLPEKLRAIARLSGVEALLTGGYSPAGAATSVSSSSASSSSDSSR